MITDDLELKLIEINNNPSLTICSTITGKLIPKLIEDTIKIAVDPYFGPGAVPVNPSKGAIQTKLDIGDFELIYSSI